MEKFRWHNSPSFDQWMEGGRYEVGHFERPRAACPTCIALDSNCGEHPMDGMFYEVFLEDRLLGRIVGNFYERAVAPEASCLLVMTLESEEGGCRIYKVATY